MASKPPNSFDPFVEELLDSGLRVLAKAAKRGAAAVVASALEDGQKLHKKLGDVAQHAQARLKNLMEDDDDARH